MSARPGWGWFAAWIGAGALFAFSLVAAASIGLFILPFALLSVWAILRASPPWPTAFGFLSGAGLVCLFIWALNRDSRPCPESGEVTLPPSATSDACGGFDATPFFLAGIVLTLMGPSLFATVGRRGRPGRLG